MTNLDRARAAFERWATEYATTPKPDECAKGGELLAALEACGVETVTRSLRRSRTDSRTVELICFADDGMDSFAVYRLGGGNGVMTRSRFLRTFAPLGGG